MGSWAIKHSELGYFKPSRSKSLKYDQRDFVEGIEDAYLYSSERFAIGTAMKLIKLGDLSIIPVTVVAREGKSLRDIMLEKANEAQQLIDEVGRMSSAEVEQLSEVRWKEYKAAREIMKMMR